MKESKKFHSEKAGVFLTDRESRVPNVALLVFPTALE
jgi:hypothetical protein